MSIIIVVVAFILFLTYGISEHVLVISLHNIRVFLSRMFNRIINLFNKHKLKSSDWDNTIKTRKQPTEYRSYRKYKDDSLEQNLLVQLQKLEQEKTDLKKQNRELSLKYNEKLSSLFSQIKDCQNTINKVKSENEEYRQKLNGLQPVDKNSIVIPFCEEYEQVMSITNKLVDRLVFEFEKLPDFTKKRCYPFLVEIVYDKLEERNNPIVIWYLLLKNIALIPKELTYDLASKNDKHSKLEFLQKYAFENFYRNHIASVVLFAENVRYSVVEQDRRDYIQDAIFELIESLHVYGINVDYIPINTIIPDADFSKYEIESTTNESEEENKVLRIKKYAVNHSGIYAETEKTVLMINI